MKVGVEDRKTQRRGQRQTHPQRQHQAAAAYPFVANPRTAQELGEPGLTELGANLWPKDCQTCGWQLGNDQPTLVSTASSFSPAQRCTISAAIRPAGCKTGRVRQHAQPAGVRTGFHTAGTSSIRVRHLRWDHDLAQHSTAASPSASTASVPSAARRLHRSMMGEVAFRDLSDLSGQHWHVDVKTRIDAVGFQKPRARWRASTARPVVSGFG
jgi:hypothetical protein